jgi:glycosyltransferase involved in cell wall biosynthesis
LSPSAIRPRLVVVTNIPSPYRLHEFAVLYNELAARGIDFEAVFLAVTERGRHWQFDISQCNFPHQIVSSRSFHIQGKLFMTNPHVIWTQWQKPPTWLWLGGSWYFPTIFALSWLSRLRRSWVLCWNESTEEDHHVLSSKWGKALRRFLLRPYHGWTVPGQRAAEYVVSQTGRPQPTIPFGNTVDETLYRDRVVELRHDRDELRTVRRLLPDEMVFLWPARLSPEKGILPFLEAIKFLKTGYTILIAGEGPQRAEIEKWLAHTPLPVRLLGHQDIDGLLELYALADVLLLPSLSEPYGFVAVEALWAGLPLLLSNRVGAIPEVLRPGENGWLIYPEEPEMICQVFSEIVDGGTVPLHQMGQVSRALAEGNFSTELTTKHFVEDLLSYFPPKD